MTPEEREEIKAAKPKIENRAEMSGVMQAMVRDLCDTASLTIGCDFCGRYYFGTSGDYEEDEQVGLIERAELNPEMYIEVDGFTAHCEINGTQFVFECDCNGPRAIENFVWSERAFIATYLSLRVEGQAKELRRNTEIVERIPIKKVSEFEVEEP